MFIEKIYFKNKKLFIKINEEEDQFRPICLVGPRAHTILGLIADGNCIQEGEKIPFVSSMFRAPNAEAEILRELARKRNFNKDPDESEDCKRWMLCCPDLDQSLTLQQQLDFFSQIEFCLNAGLIFTTKYPYLVSDCLKEDVYVCEKEYKITQPDFQTFGSSVNLITMKIFGKQETTSTRALQKIQSAIDQKDIKLLDDSKLGDSIEKTLAYHAILHKEKEEEDDE